MDGDYADTIGACVEDVRTLALYDLLKARSTHTVAVASPAVATDWSVTVPPGSVWRVLAVAASLATDANVANRTVTWRYTDGVSAIQNIPCTTVQTNGQTIAYRGVTGLGFATSAASIALIPLPSDPFWMPAGYTFGVTTSSLQVGDQWSGILLTVLDLSIGQVFWTAELIGRELAAEIPSDYDPATPLPIAAGQVTPVFPLAR